MAIFNDKIVSAQFINPEKTLIEILYKENDKVIPYVLEVDFTQNDFQDLLKELTLDEIEENTKAVLDQEGKFFETAINSEIERRWANELDKIEKAYDEAYAEVDKEIDRRWSNEMDKIEKAYKEIDHYSEEEKLKIESEMKKMRQKLQSGFTMNVKTDPAKPKDMINSFVDNNEDKDFVFGMKVSILEDPIIAKSKDKAMKMEIRKAKTVMELLKIYTTQKV